MTTAQEWIDGLQLTPHQEGGYFKELPASTALTTNQGVTVPCATTIYFLLTAENPSRFHRLQSEEIWFYHDGQPLTIHMIDAEGQYTTVTLGKDLSQGQHLQYTVPANVIFGSSVADGYALVSCVVSPGFTYEQFELLPQHSLLAQYPQHATIIHRLSK